MFAEKITSIEKISLPETPEISKKANTTTCRLYLRVNTTDLEGKRIQVHSILKDYPGIYPYCFVLSENRKKIDGNSGYRTSGHPALIEKLRILLGEENVVWKDLG